MPALESPRAMLETRLAPYLPDEWEIVPYADSIDVPEHVTLMLRLVAYRRYDPAPLAGRIAEFEFILVTPHQDIERAEDDLDFAFIDFTDVLQKLSNIVWTRADRITSFSSSAFAMQINADVFVETT